MKWICDISIGMIEKQAGAKLGQAQIQLELDLIFLDVGGTGLYGGDYPFMGGGGLLLPEENYSIWYQYQYEFGYWYWYDKNIILKFVWNEFVISVSVWLKNTDGMSL